MSTLAQDIRYAWRTIRKSPGVALVVIVSLALGIGANTLIYSVVDGIVLRPFPYPNADRLVSVGVTFPALNGERTFIESRLTAAAKESYPLDPADDPGLLRCEPWGLARQMFAPHQLEIRGRGRDQIELHYGEWDARRIVHMDGRPRPAGPVSPLGYSVGHWEGATLVVETSGVAANQTGWRSKHSDQLRVTERFTRAADGKTLNLVATFDDPWSLREPLVLKKIWSRAPASRIAPYDACEPPPSVKRGVAP